MLEEKSDNLPMYITQNAAHAKNIVCIIYDRLHFETKLHEMKCLDYVESVFSFPITILVGVLQTHVQNY